MIKILWLEKEEEYKPRTNKINETNKLKKKIKEYKKLLTIK